MDEQTQAQAAEDLQVIRRMIAQTTASAGPYWTSFFVWGGLGIIASLVCHVCLVRGWYAAIGPVWLAYGVIGAIASRSQHSAGRRTFLDRALGNTWNGVGITTVVLILAAMISKAFQPWLIGGLIALEIGLGLFVTGALLESGAWYAAAMLWWAGGVVDLIHPEGQFLVQAALFTLGYIVPGIITRRQVQRLEAVRATGF